MLNAVCGQDLLAISLFRDRNWIVEELRNKKKSFFKEIR